MAISIWITLTAIWTMVIKARPLLYIFAVFIPSLLLQLDSSPANFLWRYAVTLGMALIGTLLGVLWKDQRDKAKKTQEQVDKLRDVVAELRGQALMLIESKDAIKNTEEAIIELKTALLGVRGEEDGGLAGEVRRLRVIRHDLATPITQNTLKIDLLENRLERLERLEGKR